MNRIPLPYEESNKRTDFRIYNINITINMRTFNCETEINYIRILDPI